MCLLAWPTPGFSKLGCRLWSGASPLSHAFYLIRFSALSHDFPNSPGQSAKRVLQSLLYRRTSKRRKKLDHDIPNQMAGGWQGQKIVLGFLTHGLVLAIFLLRFHAIDLQTDERLKHTLSANGELVRNLIIPYPFLLEWVKGKWTKQWSRLCLMVLDSFPFFVQLSQFWPPRSLEEYDYLSSPKFIIQSLEGKLVLTINTSTMSQAV